MIGRGLGGAQTGTSLVAQTVKSLSTMRETRVQSLGREVPLEKEMATRCSILAWEIPWTEEPGRLQSMGSQWTCGIWAASCPGVSTNIGASQPLLEGYRETVRTLFSHCLLFPPWDFSAWTLNTASFCDSLICSPDLARESGKTQAWMLQ